MTQGDIAMPEPALPCRAAARHHPSACIRWPLAGIAALVATAALAPLPATANDTLVRFDGGIGSQPLRAEGLVNDVRGLSPGGRPWVIERLKAEVRSDGRIRVEGRGLLLAGGNGIGTAGGQSVHARLYCDAAFSDTKAVPLDEDGDFRIDDVLIPTPPSVCNTPVLLILNPNNAWFAAGIPKR
jgi:hypothetical protein